MGSLFETAQMIAFELAILKLRPRFNETARDHAGAAHQSGVRPGAADAARWRPLGIRGARRMETAPKLQGFETAGRAAPGYIDQPPSTRWICPVVKALSSEAR